MPVYDHIQSWGDDLTEYRAWSERQRRVAARAATYDTDAAIRLSQHARYYPDTSFGLLDAFVQEGLAPDDPRVRQIADTNYHYNARNGSPGERGQIVLSSFAANVAQWNQNRGEREGIIDSLLKRPAFNTASMPQRLQMIQQASARSGIPINYETVLTQAGILQNGQITRPARPTYMDGKWSYENDQDRNLDSMWKELMQTIATDQKTNDPIPFMDAEGEQMLFHPLTGKTSVATPRPRDGLIPGMPEGYAPGIPDSVDEMWNRVVSAGQETVANWMERRPARLPGTQQSAGFNPTMSPKDVIRGAGMVGNASIQEGYGVVRTLYGAAHGQGFDWQSQSDLGVAAQGGGLSATGTGYLVDPESAVARERVERERSFGLIGGHAVTPGRWFADALPLTVDSKPYTVVSGLTDFAAQIADPTAFALKSTSRISAARRLFEPDETTGLFAGIRQQFHGPTFNAWKETRQGIRVREALVNASGDRTTAYDIWVAGGRKWDPETAVKLYEAEDIDTVDAVLDEAIGTRQIRSPHEIDTMPVRFGDNALLSGLTPARARVAFEDHLPQMLPDHQLDALNKRDAATQMERWMKIGKADEPVIREVFDMIARAPHRNGIEQAVEHAMKHEQGILAKSGVASIQKRRELTRLFSQSQSRALEVLADDIISDTPIRDVLMANGIEVQDISSQLSIEYLERYVPLPDIDRIKRVTADPKYRWLLTSMNGSEIGKPHLPESAMNFMMEEMWKPAMLLGRFPAWITRVIGDEQLRLATAGLNGMFNHPVQAFAIMIGRKIKSSPSGSVWDDLHDYENALSRTHGGMIRRTGSTSSRPRHYDKMNPDEIDDYYTSYADNIAKLWYDPVSRNLIQTDVDQTLAWMKGPGREFLTKLQTAEPGKFTTDKGIRDYLTNVLGDRINLITKNNPELLDAIRAGNFQGTAFFRKGGPRLNPKFIQAMTPYADEYGPRFIKGFESSIPGKMAKYDAFIDWAFANTMSRATNFASRSPTFKQFTWEEIVSLMPYVDGPTRNALIANAEKANLPRSMMRRFNKGKMTKGNTYIHSVEEAETIATGYALDRTKQVLYDLSERGNLAESLKILAPFGNAYQELITAWPKLLAGEKYGWIGKAATVGRAGRRVQQTIEGGRRNGWFMKNQFKEEVFVFPFSEAYTESVTGMPLPMTGRLEGLNMAFDVYPGMGPIAAVPVAWMMDGKPGTMQEIYDRVLPYGAPGERDPNQATNLLAYAPSWMQKMALAMSAGPPPGIDKASPLSMAVEQFTDKSVSDLWPSRDEVMWDNNAYMNTQKDVMRYLLSTGDYDVSTREGFQQMLEDAKEKATDLYYIRAAMQFFAPTAPTYEFVAQDKSGTLIAQAAVTEEFYYMLDEEGMTMDEASIELLNKYGPDILSLTVPKTRAATYNVPRSEEAGAWLSEHEGVRLRYPGSYGFFAPQGGELDYSVLVDQYASGDVEVLTPEQWLNLRNDMLKNMEYHYYLDQVGPNPSDEQAAWLRQIKSELEEAYPSTPTGVSEKPNVEDLLPELYDAIQDPELRDTPTAQALTAYFYYRDQAVAQAQAYGYAGFARPNAMRGTREWLAGVARNIMKDYPEFELVWSTTLSQEFERELR